MLQVSAAKVVGGTRLEAEGDQQHQEQRQNRMGQTTAAATLRLLVKADGARAALSDHHWWKIQP